MKFFHLPILASLLLLTTCKPKPAPPSCGTDEMLHEMRLADPAFLQKEKQFEKGYREAMLSKEKYGTGELYTLPVIVHIIHNNGAENIPDAQVMQALEYLNQAFRNTDYYNPATGADIEIEFCLAQRDPDNNATSGIIRYQSPITDMSAGFYHGDVASLASWSSEDYINIRLVKEVCTTGSCYAAGYASHDWIGGGIVMEAYYFGSSPENTSVLTHEMGHYLGLAHTFNGGCANNDCLSDGDRVCDTPPDNTNSPFPCDAVVNSCYTDADDPSVNNPFRSPLVGGLGDQPDINGNYMDYGFVFCHDHFTEGQKARMHYFLENARFSLLASKACLPPCPSNPIALFSASANNIEVGSTLVLTNLSTNAEQYHWYVNGVLVSEMTDLNHIFLVEGTYTVSLQAENTLQECDPVSYEQTIIVSCPVEASFSYEIHDNWLVFQDLSTNTNALHWTIKNGAGGLLFSSMNTLDSMFVGNQEYIQLSLTASNGFCEDLVFEYIKLTIDGSEICNNSIDDDGDGLVDLFDPNCSCNDEAYQAFCPVSCEYIPDSFPQIELELEWVSEVIFSSSGATNMITVGNTNNDGIVEMITPSVIGTDINNIDNRILITDGETGNTIQSIDLSVLYPIGGGSSTPILADIDADGVSELFAKENSRFYCFNLNGDLRWISDVLQDGTSRKEACIADFNGDGIPEIYVGNEIINTQNGKLLLKGTEGKGCHYFNIWTPCFRSNTVAADLLLNAPGLELAAGNTVYQIEINNLDGIIGNVMTPVIAPDPVVDGVTSIGDVNGDGALDVIVVASNTHPNGGGIWVWDPRTLNIIASAEAGEGGGVAFVGDVTGDCLPEIGMTFKEELRMYQYNGSPQLQLLYSLPTTDGSGFTGLTMFDFNQDGKQELIYRDETDLRILEGETGSTLASYPLRSDTGAEYPVVADVDGDGQAEILIAGAQDGIPETRVYCFGSGGAPWAPARSVWNQYSYHVTNVNDDLTIPRQQQNGAIPLEGYENCLRPSCPTPYNNFLSQATYRTQEGCVQFPTADLLLDIIAYECSPDSLFFDLAISSQGDKKTEEDCVYISAYSTDPSANAVFPFEIICYSPADTVIWNDTIRVAIDLPSSLSQTYWVINDLGTGANADNYEFTKIIECNYTNNTDFLHLDIEAKELDLGPDITKCASEVFTFNAGAGFESYSWSDNTVDSIYSSSFEGLHFVEATDHCGRIYRDTVVINIDTTDDVDLGADIITCPNDELGFNVAAHFDFVTWLPALNVNCDTCLEVNITADTSFSLIVVAGDGACFSIDTVAIQYTPAVIVTESRSICEGESLLYEDSLLTNAGSYTFALNDCDSILQLNLSVNSIDTLLIEQTICAGDSTFFDDNWRLNEGIYSLTEMNLQGCDSTTMLDLSVTQAIFTSDTLVICEGDSTSVFGQWVSTTMTLSESYTSFATCDSTQVFYIEIAPFVLDTIIATICEGDSVFIGQTWLSEPGLYDFLLAAEVGCDTSLHLELMENTIVSNLDTLVMCEGDSIRVFDQWVFTDMLLEETFTSILDCDSIQSFQVFREPLVQAVAEYHLCERDSVQLGSQWLSGAGLYSVLINATTGCDTLVEVEIIEIPPVVIIDTITVCQGDSVLVENEWLLGAGAYLLPANPQLECDTFFQVELLEFPPILNVDTLMICAGDSINVFGLWVANDTLMSETSNSFSGCDSTQVFQVLRVPFIPATETYTLCEGDSVLVDTQWLTEAGLYSFFLNAQTGCDTLLEVEITTIFSVINTDTVSFCTGDSLMLFDEYVFSAGEYTEIFIGSNGCDSTQTYLVEMLPLGFDADTLSICEGDSVFLSNQWAQTTGIYLDTIASLPCNTITSTFLEIKNTFLSSSNIELCPGDSIWLDNDWVMAPNEVELTYLATNGCDSVQVITVTELASPNAPNATLDCDKLEVVVTIEAAAPWGILWNNGDTSTHSSYSGGEMASVTLSSVMPLCEKSFNLSLPVLPLLTDINLFQQDTSIRKGRSFMLELDLNSSEWSILWSPAAIFSCDTCMSTLVSPIENTIVDFNYTHESGCTYQNSFEITVEEEGGIYIPNVFSPNRDGANDQWRVLPPKGVASFDEVLIFSRWGSLVASWKGIPQITWDGTFKGELMNPSVFVYYIRYTNLDGEKREKKGSVTILR